MEVKEWQQAGIDYEEGLARMCGNEQMYHKYLKKFLEDESYRMLVQCMEEGRIEDAKTWIHTLKGTTATLGFKTLSEHCRQEEAKLKAGAQQIDLALIGAAYAAVQEAIKTLE